MKVKQYDDEKLEVCIECGTKSVEYGTCLNCGEAHNLE